MHLQGRILPVSTTLSLPMIHEHRQPPSKTPPGAAVLTVWSSLGASQTFDGRLTSDVDEGGPGDFSLQRMYIGGPCSRKPGSMRCVRSYSTPPHNFGLFRSQHKDTEGMTTVQTDTPTVSKQFNLYNAKYVTPSTSYILPIQSILSPPRGETLKQVATGYPHHKGTFHRLSRKQPPQCINAKQQKEESGTLDRVASIYIHRTTSMCVKQRTKPTLQVGRGKPNIREWELELAEEGIINTRGKQDPTRALLKNTKPSVLL
ncbi:hypothetical protein BJ508DRAFT_305129 [Ascobolus immersus RN42]|uniref:Uncharacterized protein n=1 Tax=Ascobolus immersus RN42 TaxID=1160509 RepID=A0A3N4IF51_ASCIM|nr:hypothetical protein BJ508DRAFT_305129 [Ascobolus immersus RN42]